MISDGIYFRNVIIQALNDLVLESFVFCFDSFSAFVFGFVWSVFFAMYFCVLGNKLYKLCLQDTGRKCVSMVPPQDQTVVPLVAPVFAKLGVR